MQHLNSSSTTPPHRNGGGRPIQQHRPNGGNANDSQAVPNTSRTNIFIRYLPKYVDDEELARLFTPFGAIATSMVMRDIHTGESLGTAFVRYESPRDADSAKRAMDHYRMGEKKLSLQWARREHDFKTANNDEGKRLMHKLFLRNVPLSINTDSLGQLLSVYGPVTAVSIHADTQNPEYSDTHDGSSGRSSAGSGPFGFDDSSNTSVSGDAAPLSDDGAHGGTRVFVQPPSDPLSAPTALPLARRIAFVTFAEMGAAERALKGVHNCCPYPECKGIPFMGKLINDNLMSKKQQRFHSLDAAPAHPTAPGSGFGCVPQPIALPTPHGGSPQMLLPSPTSTSSYGHPAATHFSIGSSGNMSHSHSSYARSPTFSQNNMSTSDLAKSDGVMYQAYHNGNGNDNGFIQSAGYGNSLGAYPPGPYAPNAYTPQDGCHQQQYQALAQPQYQPQAQSQPQVLAQLQTSSRSVTPTSEANGTTPRAVSGARLLPQPLSQHSLQSGSSSSQLAGTSPGAVSPGAGSSTASSPQSRTRRYTHNPYASLVIQ